MIWPFRRKPRRRQAVPRTPTIAVESTPDTPVPFGFKTVWWAIRHDSIDAVADSLQLRNREACNWRSGVKLSYNGGLFLTPEIDGWILVCGRDLPPNSEAAAEQIEFRLCFLSERFGDVQAFATHRVVEYHVWARARDGVLTRGFGYLGESGLTFWDEGFDDAENDLGFDFVHSTDALTDQELEERDWPSEEHVMDVARVWSLCPNDLDGSIQPGVGLTGDSAAFFDESWHA